MGESKPPVATEMQSDGSIAGPQETYPATDSVTANESQERSIRQPLVDAVPKVDVQIESSDPARLIESTIGTEDPRSVGAASGPGDEAEVDSYTKSLARFTKLMAYATVTLAVVGVIQLYLLRESIEDTGKAADAAISSAETAKNALESANRAWIAPLEMRLLAPLTLNSQVSFAVRYSNSGTTPAMEALVYVAPFRTIDPPQSGTTWLASGYFGDNNACSDADTMPADQTIYPSIDREMQSTFITNVPLLDRTVIEGQRALVFHGCIAYVTFGIKRHSQFCFFLEPVAGQSSDQWLFKFCPQGNAAD